MRGDDTQPAALFSYVQLEDRSPADHPLRVIRALVDPLLVALSPASAPCTPSTGDPRLLPRSSCVPYCSRCSTRSAASAS